MNQPALSLLLILLVSKIVIATPPLTSWYTDQSSRYARIYETWADETAGNDQTVWVHPNGGNSQTLPSYCGVHEVSSSTDWVYVRTTGLGSHIMGPWYQNNANPGSAIFVNWPSNTATLFRIPRIDPANPPLPAAHSLTGGGPIGLFVDGVVQFDSRDAFSYSAANSADANPQSAFNGDGHWNRDAFINEGHTFDRANAHQAGAQYHYHANPIALRHLLGDSVTYGAATNLYTEAPNGTHSPILGWCRDGLPIYGPYGYSVANNASSPVARMRSGFVRRDGTNGTTDLTATGRTTWPAWADRVYNNTAGTVVAAPTNGPAVSAAQTLGHYLEDNAYLGDLGKTQGADFDLDEHNARFCVTPEYPAGTWAYFVAIDASGAPVYPYNLGRTYKATPQGSTIGDIPEPVTIVFAGGTTPDPDLCIDSTTPFSDVTLTWSAIEGGTYEIQTSPDSNTWAPWMSYTSTGPVPDASVPDLGTAGGTTPRQFYRTDLQSLAPFDTAGHPAQQTTTMSATLTVAPPNLSILPAITISGPTSIPTPIAYTRPSRYELVIDVDPATLAPGIYTITVPFPSGAGTQTATYAVADNTTSENVLLVIVDDWGIDSSDLYNTNPAATLPPMPTLQSLANNGVVFQNAYAQPTCSPTRSGIITGRYSFRNGVGNPAIALNVSEFTMPEAFGSTNSHYQIAGFGKWHISASSNNPLTNAAKPRTEGGWPYYEGTFGNITDYSNWDKIENDTLLLSVTNYATSEIADDVIDWVGTQDPSSPWFAWVAFQAGHTPFHVPPSNLHSFTGITSPPTGPDREPAYQAALESLDTELGRILANIDTTVTNVIVIGDNGTPQAALQQPFHTTNGRTHSKGSLYEGGTRVPLLVSGPAVTGTGRVSNALVHCVDLFSTILDLSGIPTGITGATPNDSVSLVDVLANTSTTAHSKILVETFGNAIAATDQGRAVYDGTYKVVEYTNGGGTGIASHELYHIPSDENEETDLNDGSMTAAETTAFNALTNALSTDTY